MGPTLRLFAALVVLIDVLHLTGGVGPNAH